MLIAAGGLATTQAPDTILVRAMPIDEIGELAFRAGIALHELSPHAGSLEELFLGWTGAASSKEVIGL